MLYIKSFSNYEEFSQLFGVREFNGCKSRNNKILLALLKDKELLHEAVKNGDLSLFSITNMVDLKNTLIQRIHNSGARSYKLSHPLELLGNTYYSDIYSLDVLKGICEDGTPNAVRYVNNELGRVFKMKCGKFMKHLIECTKFGKMLPQQVVTYLCEEFNRDWQAYAIGMLPKNKLYVNDNFSDIYDSERLKGYDTRSDSFVSCMVNKDLWSFYRDSVKAKAAYLEDEKGMIIARCIIFTDVFDEDGKKYRYAERQYSTDGNDVYKQALIDALIQAGEIDCYKKIGAACSESTAIVDINGNSLSDKRFHIKCNLGWADCLSYQDTFKWYSMYNKEAYNYESGDYMLDVTDGSLEESEGEEEPEEYDSYHERNAYEVCTVYYHGNEETCDSECMDDFIEFQDEYYHEDDIMFCPVCGKKMLNPEYYDEDFCHSKLTEEDYCCEDCLERGEKKYRAENMHYSAYDDEWYHSASNVTTYLKYDCISGEYEEVTISTLSLREGIEKGEFHKYLGRYYDVINQEVGRPYGFETIIEFAV